MTVHDLDYDPREWLGSPNFERAGGQYFASFIPPSTVTVHTKPGGAALGEIVEARGLWRASASGDTYANGDLRNVIAWVIDRAA